MGGAQPHGAGGRGRGRPGERGHWNESRKGTPWTVVVCASPRLIDGASEVPAHAHIRAPTRVGVARRSRYVCMRVSPPTCTSTDCTSLRLLCHDPQASTPQEQDGRTRSTKTRQQASRVSARSDAEYLCVPRPPNDGMCQADVSPPLRWLGREGAGTGRGSTPEGTERGD